MSAQPKRLPRLWCALQGLLPLESCRAAERAELAWPREPAISDENAGRAEKPLKHVAGNSGSMNVRRRGPLRNQM